MASVTFGSFGDIVTICTILIKSAKALSDSRGSAAEYQQLISQLQCLTAWEEAIGTLLIQYPRLRHNEQLREIIDCCKDHMLQYTKSIESFRPSLGRNPSASNIKQVCRKLRWLSRKDDVAAFQRSVAVYNNAISGILVAAGVDAVHECHRQSMQSMEGLLTDVQSTLREIRIDQVNTNTRLLTEAGETSSALVRQHDKVDRSVQDMHTEMRSSFNQLQTAISRSSPNTQGSMQIVPVTSVAELNRLYMRLIMELLGELAKLGLIGFYQALQLLRCFLLRKTLPSAVQAKYFIFRGFGPQPLIIDVSYTSYIQFFRFLEHGWSYRCCAKHHEFGIFAFINERNLPIHLESAWLNDTLQGKLIQMTRPALLSLDPEQEKASMKWMSYPGEVEFFSEGKRTFTSYDSGGFSFCIPFTDEAQYWTEIFMSRAMGSHQLANEADGIEDPPFRHLWRELMSTGHITIF